MLTDYDESFLVDCLKVTPVLNQIFFKETTNAVVTGISIEKGTM